MISPASRSRRTISIMTAWAILFRNYAGGIATWDMNDTTIIGVGSVASLPSNWNIIVQDASLGRASRIFSAVTSVVWCWDGCRGDFAPPDASVTRIKFALVGY